MLDAIKIWKHQGKQFIPDVTKAGVPGIFRGRPELSTAPLTDIDREAVANCPTDALSIDGNEKLSLDLGKCVFCGLCEIMSNKVRFTTDYKMATTRREDLIIHEGITTPIHFDADSIRKEIHGFFGSSLKLRQVSAAGDNSSELELNASGNVNFDMGRFGIEFVASPRHADGVVISGPISENMSRALQICYDAIPDPKIVVLAGSDTISGGIFAGSSALQRDFIEKYKVDLFVPGSPLHPLTFVNGILSLINAKK